MTYSDGLRYAANKLSGLVYEHNASDKATNIEVLIFRLGELAGSLFKEARERGNDGDEKVLGNALGADDGDYDS